MTVIDHVVERIKQWPGKEVSIAPLVTFRIIFGILMLFSLLRFWYWGWIEDLYVEPNFHFTFPGFGWVTPLGYWGMHALFLILCIATICIALGLFYRLSCVIFFLGFTYVELIDVATYLNHYYFISLVAFLLIWLPAGKRYSLDVWRDPPSERTMAPLLCIGILRFQMGALYFFAGVAKLNADWLFHALPLSIWLPAKSHLPLIGPYLYYPFTAYLFSWFGALYDLSIAFFLLSKRTRPFAYLLVLVFHGATAFFFPAIGMFPYIMICITLIFFSGDFHERILQRLPGYKRTVEAQGFKFKHPTTISLSVGLYMVIQVLVPLRFLAYPGDLFWREEGYRFSWRVMLMEKSGAAYFTVKSEQRSYAVNNPEFLTPLQEKMMSTQPDMILQYAHFLANTYRDRGLSSPEVYSEIYVSLNGRHSRLLVDTMVNLAAQAYSFKPYTWVLD